MWRLTIVFCCSILHASARSTPPYIMSKQPAAKRKKTSEDVTTDEEGSGMNNILANLDISDTSITPKILSKALLSLLPDDATKQHSSAKKLVSPNICCRYMCVYVFYTCIVHILEEDILQINKTYVDVISSL